MVVGCGAGGGVLTQRLARRGWKVVTLDAGPFWDPDRDWVSDEAGSHHLYWTEPRVISGNDPVPLGSNNSGRGVGGSMVHYAGYTPRFHPSDFATCTDDGVGADWPIDVRAICGPTTHELEEELPVAGQDWPWGDPHRYPQSPHPVGGQRRGLPAGLQTAGHRGPGGAGGHHQRALRQSPPLHLPGLLHPGLQGQRQGLARSSPTCPTPWPTGPRSGPTAWSAAIEVGAGRPGHRRDLPAPGGRAPPAGPHGGRGRVLDRDAPAAAQLGLPTGSPTACATSSTRSAAT